MTDKELLEKAAKAAGRKPHPIISGAWSGDKFEPMRDMGSSVMVPTVWNPLTDDGDALRLAVKLGMRVYVYNGGGDDYTCVATDELSFTQETIKVMHDEDSASATRRAITRAAAEMVKE